MLGSAISLTCVRSKPIPAKETVAATFAFFGNVAAASLALPEKKVAGSFKAVRFNSRSASVPFQACGGFRPTYTTESKPTRCAADKASMPPIAPDKICSRVRPLIAACSRSYASMASESAPEETIADSTPERKASSTVVLTASCPAHSISKLTSEGSSVDT